MKIIKMKDFLETNSYKEQLRFMNRSKQLCDFLELHHRVKDNKLTDLDIDKGFALLDRLINTAKTTEMVKMSLRYKQILKNRGGYDKDNV